ncbi:MAG: hypothetical protein NTX05_02455 [Fusobacteria bacterium]|nr:hypothetical protein [Fusobacteriota bacterium]
MHRVAVVGTDDSILIFARLGFEVHVISSSHFEPLLERLCSENVAIIYVVETLMQEFKVQLKSYQRSEIPAIIAIPQGKSMGVSGEHISELAEKAIGMDMF